MAYGLLRALPGVHDFLVTVTCGSSPASLAPAKGRQNHTTSPYATVATRLRAATSIASCLAFRDDGRTPLLPRQDARIISMIFDSDKAKYLWSEGLTGIRKIRLSGKSVGLRRWDFEGFRRSVAPHQASFARYDFLVVVLLLGLEQIVRRKQEA
jgi:hypothetical protein